MLRGNMLLLMQAESKVLFLLKNRFFKHQIKEYLDRGGEKMVEYCFRRGVEQSGSSSGS